MSRALPILVVLAIGAARPALAQTYTAAADVLFYGDNSEFANPFRAGDTTFGAAGRLAIEIDFNDTVRLRGGLFGLGRFGAREFLEHGEPLLALEVSHGASRFIFGSLETVATDLTIAGPDLETPHRLLPPLHEETLTFRRGQEMGLQWLVASPRLTHDAWINWQRLNTAAARERFDAGYRARVTLSPAVALHGQWHVVHEGGQQFAAGPVRDSQGGAVGLELARGWRRARVVVDAHAVATRDVPDRERPAQARSGLGVFARAAVSDGPWRTHLIVWRGCDAIKEEGDANYLATRRDGTRFRAVRDYAELGVTRQFRPAPGVHIFASARYHRVEAHFDYSYRITARVRLRQGL